MIQWNQKKNLICQNGKYKEYCQKVADPVKVLKQFTKYYYIPVRIDYNSIPENVQNDYL